MPDFEPLFDSLKIRRRGPLDLDLDRLVAAAPHHQRDLAVRRPAQLLLDLWQGHVVGRLLVDAENQIAGLDVDLGGGRSVARRHDLGDAVVHRQHEPGRGAVLRRLRLQCLVLGFGQVHRARIETGQHAGDRGAHELAVADRLDRVVADPLERLAEQVQLLVNGAARAARCSLPPFVCGAAVCDSAVPAQRHRRRNERDQSERQNRFTDTWAHNCGSPAGSFPETCRHTSRARRLLQSPGVAKRWRLAGFLGPAAGLTEPHAPVPLRGASPEQHAETMPDTKHTAFSGRLVIVGFGSIGQGVLPLLMRQAQMCNTDGDVSEPKLSKFQRSIKVAPAKRRVCPEDKDHGERPIKAERPIQIDECPNQVDEVR